VSPAPATKLQTYLLKVSKYISKFY